MKRLLEGDGSELERGLLDALKLETPGAELEQRMRDALGLGPIPPAPPPVAAPVAPAAKTFGSVAAIAAGAVVAAALLVGGGMVLKQRAASGDAPTPPAPVKIVTPAEPALPAPTPAVAPETQAPDLDVLDGVDGVDGAKPRARKPQSGSVSSAQSLREEIRLIDSARVAVKKNERSRALGILDRYEHRFPAGTFQEEARVLRREALKNQGEGR